MLQFHMFSQLARLKTFVQLVTQRQLMFNPNSLGPWKAMDKYAKMERLYLGRYSKHWYCGGKRSLAIAVNLLMHDKIIAIPTDTIYGLAGIAQSDYSVAQLYAIKKRDLSKPLAICLWDINDIGNWAETEDLPPELIEALLPGPVTIILKRKPILNPSLNPGVDSVGIRIPNSPFLRSIIRYIGQPLALTSANESNATSTLYAEEFQKLWPELGGIFYSRSKIRESTIRRAGSTIVDLTEKGYFKIIRTGRAVISTRAIINKFGWIEIKNEIPKEEKDSAEKVALVE